MAEDGAKEEVGLFVHMAAGKKVPVRGALGATVGALKQRLEGPTGVAAAQQRLIHTGKVLQDAKTLASSGAPRRPLARCRCTRCTFCRCRRARSGVTHPPGSKAL